MKTTQVVVGPVGHNAFLMFSMFLHFIFIRLWSKMSTSLLFFL